MSHRAARWKHFGAFLTAFFELSLSVVVALPFAGSGAAIATLRIVQKQMK